MPNTRKKQMPRKSQAATVEVEEDATTPQEDRQVYQHRNNELDEARLLSKSHLICLKETKAEIARGKVVVRDLDTDHLEHLVTLMSDGIVEHLLSFRCFILTTGEDTKDEATVSKIITEIESGHRILYFLSGFHRYNALKKVQPGFIALMQIYDSELLSWSACQYIATRDNKELSDELVQSHKTLTIKDETNVVRNVLLQVEHQLNQHSDRLAGIEYTRPANTAENDQQRRLLFQRIQSGKNLICQTTRDTFLKTVNAEIRAGLYLNDTEHKEFVKTLKNLAFLTEERYEKVIKFITLLEAGKILLPKQRTIRAFLQMIFGRSQIPRQDHEDFGVTITEEILAAAQAQPSGHYNELSKRDSYNELSRRCWEFYRKPINDDDEEEQPGAPQENLQESSSVVSSATTITPEQNVPSKRLRTSTQTVKNQASINEPARKRIKLKSSPTKQQSAAPTSKAMILKTKLPTPNNSLTTETNQQDSNQQNAEDVNTESLDNLDQRDDDLHEDASSSHQETNQSLQSPSAQDDVNNEVSMHDTPPDLQKDTLDYTIPADFKHFFQQSIDLATAYNLSKANRTRKLADEYNKMTQHTKDFVKQLLPDKAFKSIFLKPNK